MDSTYLPSWMKSQKIIKLFRFLSLFVITSLLTYAIPSFSASGNQNNIPTGPYTNFSLTANSPNGITRVEYGLIVEEVTPNSNYFYSNQFGIENGDGGYIGLQEKGSRVNGTTGKTAVFSIFGAGIQASPASNCSVESPERNFDGYVGKAGTSCRIAYNWQKNVKYSFLVQRIRTDESGSWWAGKIINKTTNESTLVAEIKVPYEWKGLKSFTTLWTEYFGALPATCKDLAYSRARFFPPIVNEKFAPFIENRYSTIGTCSNTYVRKDGESYLQEMGGLTQRPATPPPVTEPRVTDPPVTQPPVSSPPVTQPPATQPPVTQPPSTQPPVTQPPINQPPSELSPPQNIKVNFKDCFFLWCTVTINWSPSNIQGVQYTLVPRGRSQVTTSSTSIAFPFVFRGNTYKIEMYSSYKNVRSSTVSFSVRVN